MIPVGYIIYIWIYQNNNIAGLNKYNLINIFENNPFLMSCFWSIFFIIIGMTQLNKVYINSKCIYKIFTIRKKFWQDIILFTLECVDIYNKFDPDISFGKEKYNFHSKKYCLYF